MVQNPPYSQEKQAQDPVPSSEIVLVEEEDVPAGFEVPTVEGTQNGTVAMVEEEDDPTRPQVPAIEGTQSNIAIDVTRAEVADPEEHLEEEIGT